MNILLEEYIRKSVRKQLKEQEEKVQRNEKAVYLIHRFPGLKPVMEDLMSPTFPRWISSIGIVAPKPTTLKVDLINGQDFNLIYNGRNIWSAKIAGKMYYIKTLPELQRASKAIANLLSLNYEPQMSEEETKAKKSDDIKSDLDSFDTPSDPDVDLPGLPDEDTDLESDISDSEFEDVNDDEVEVDI